jgi:D-sedoheptulose 7-phosphate isomerase
MTKLYTKISETVSVLQGLNELEPRISQACDMIVGTLRSGNKLLICGNGGSAAEAAHFSTELVGRFAKKRRSLAAIALSSDGSLITCIGNDFGYDNVFARQIEGLAVKGDLVVTISSSGNSQNIINALHVARSRALNTIALLGREGGRAAGIAFCDVIVPGSSGASAQEAHLFLIHHFCAAIDEEFASD